MKREPTDDTVDGLFAPLEEKIRRVVDVCRELREERTLMQREIAGLLLEIETLSD